MSTCEPRHESDTTYSSKLFPSHIYTGSSLKLILRRHLFRQVSNWYHILSRTRWFWSRAAFRVSTEKRCLYRTRLARARNIKRFQQFFNVSSVSDARPSLSAHSSGIDMVKRFSITLTALSFAAIVTCSPTWHGGGGNSTTVASSMTPSSTAAAASASPTVPYASDDPNGILWTPDSNVVPEPVRGSLGASILGPQNIPLELQNADSMAPPTTDNGDV